MNEADGTAILAGDTSDKNERVVRSVTIENHLEAVIGIAENRIGRPIMAYFVPLPALGTAVSGGREEHATGIFHSGELVGGVRIVIVHTRSAFGCCPEKIGCIDAVRNFSHLVSPFEDVGENQQTVYVFICSSLDSDLYKTGVFPIVGRFFISVDYAVQILIIPYGRRCAASRSRNQVRG